MDNTERDYYKRHIIMCLISIILGIGSVVYGYSMRAHDPNCNVVFTWIVGSSFAILGITGIILLILEKKGKFD